MIPDPESTGTNTRDRWAGRLLTALPVVASLPWLAGTLHRAYGPTHYFLSYEHGFLKRSLLGELLLPLHSIHVHVILAIELVIFAVLVAITYIVFRRILFGSVQERALAAFLLAGPALLPHFAYLSGDLDSLLYCCAVACGGCVSGDTGHTRDLLCRCAQHRRAADPRSVSAALLSVAAGHHDRSLPASPPAHRHRACAACDRRDRHAGNPPLWQVERAAPRIHGHRAATDGHAAGRHGLSGTLEYPATTVTICRCYLRQTTYRRGPAKLPGLPALLRRPCWLLRTALAVRGYTIRSRWTLLLLLCAPLLLLPLGHDVMRWVAAVCVNISLLLLYLYETGAPAERSALTGWTATPLYGALFAYALALGPFGIASNRLVTNIGNLLSGHP